MMRVVHYLNQFFGQIGGEDKAGARPKVVEGPVGPGVMIDRLLGERGRVAATVICGDNYFAENPEQISFEILPLIEVCKPDLLIAGPAFNAGRYGIACGEICKCVKEKLGLPVVTGMFRENPAADLYRRHVYIVETARTVVGMAKAMPKIVALAWKLVTQEHIGTPREEGYLPRGVRETVVTGTLAGDRAIELLLKKMKAKPFETEISFADVETVTPASPIENLKGAMIALVTEGGLVPKGNPDLIESARANRWGKYSVDELRALGCRRFSSIHRGFDTAFVNEDCNRLVPVDVLSDLEREGFFKGIHPEFFVTTGVATTMDSARRMGKEMAADLAAARVSGALVSST